MKQTLRFAFFRFPYQRRALTACLFALLSGTWGLAQAQPSADQGSSAQLIDEVVVVVNNDIITRREVDERADLVERQFRAANRPMPSRSDLLGGTLERLVMEHLQMQEAQENGIRVSDAELDQTLEQIAKQNNMSFDEYRSQIERAGIRFSKFRAELRQDMIITRLREREVDARVQVTPVEIDNYLAELSGKPVLPAEEFNLAQIQFALPENASEAQIEAVKAKAEALLKRAQTAADFFKLTNSSDQDGVRVTELGFRTPDRLPKLFVDAVSGLRPGQVVPAVLRSPSGFHIVKLLERRVDENLRQDSINVSQTRVRHIFLRIGSGIPENEVKNRLLAMRGRLARQSADFGDLAVLYSQDGSAMRGGDLGWLSPGEMDPAFELAVAQLGQPGQISDLVRTEAGYHLIQLLARRQQPVASDKQREFARNTLRERKTDQAYQEWLRLLRDGAFIEYRAQVQ